MPKELTAKFIADAVQSLSVWNLGNEVLYKLCEEYPAHKASSEVGAKIWLIGRAYAAAIERRRDKPENKGDAFYVKEVIPKLVASDIDMWIEQVPGDADPCGLPVLRVHKQLTDLFYDIAQLEKRSLASKYLHFHRRNVFLIYDSRADKASKEICRTLPTKQRSISLEIKDGAVDGAYAAFVRRCQFIRAQVRATLGRLPTPRELDQIFLAWCSEPD